MFKKVKPLKKISTIQEDSSENSVKPHILFSGPKLFDDCERITLHKTISCLLLEAS